MGSPSPARVANIYNFCFKANDIIANVQIVPLQSDNMLDNYKNLRLHFYKIYGVGEIDCYMWLIVKKLITQLYMPENFFFIL